MRLIRETLTLALGYMGTTRLAVVSAFVVLAVTTGWKFHHAGWLAVKVSWIGNAVLGGATAAVIWLGLLIFCLGRVVQIGKTPVAEPVRPKVYVVFDWSGGLSGCWNKPFVLRNDSDMAVQEITVSPIKYESRDLGGRVDAWSRQATFPIIAFLDAHAETDLWASVANAETHSGHPDVAKFMWTALVSSGMQAAAGGGRAKDVFKHGVALPFDITYRAVGDPRLWTTRCHIEIGGKWSRGRIVVETLRFE